MSPASYSFGAGNNDHGNPFAAKPSFADASAFASQSPVSLFGRGIKPGQSATNAGSNPFSSFTSNHAFAGFSSAPSLGTSSFPRLGSLTTPVTSGWAGTMSGSTSVAPSIRTQFPSVSQNGAQPDFGAPKIGTRVTPYKVTDLREDKSFSKMHSISAMPAYWNKSHEELRWEDQGLENKGAPMGGLNPFRVDAAEHNPFLSLRTSSWADTATKNPFSLGSQNTSTGTMVLPSPSTMTPPNPFSVAASPITFPSIAPPRQPSRVTSYMATDVHEDMSFSKIHSISAMPAFSNKSHEEVRWEDQGTKSQGAVTGGFNPFRVESAEHNPFWSSRTSSWANTATKNPFSDGTQNTSAATMVFPSPSTTTLPNPFSVPANVIEPQRQPSPAVPSFFPPNTTSSFIASMTPANSLTSAKTASLSPFSFSSPMQSSVFQPSTSSLSTAIPVPQQTTFPSFQSTTSAQTNTQGSISSLFHPANPVGLAQPSLSVAPVQSSLSPQTTSSFNIGIPGQTLMTTGTGNVNTAQPAPVTNPFGILPPVPQLSLDPSRTSQPIQYGISTSRMSEKPARARSMLMTNASRGLSYRQLKLHFRKYNPRKIVSEVPFIFNDMDKGVAVPVADAFFIPRENPRDLIIRPLPQIRTSRSEVEQSPPLNTTSCAAGNIQDRPLEDTVLQQAQREAKIKALMPKLCGPDYYTEPAIQELAAKEISDPGFCSRVEEFVIGRHNYGNIRFLGDTDVRGLHLDVLVQFSHREVIVYPDETTKPLMGEELNKPAEVTLLNIKCLDKKTGHHYFEGPRVEKYTEFLKKKAWDQGARFLSYDPVKGEWKFRVDHF